MKPVCPETLQDSIVGTVHICTCLCDSLDPSSLGKSEERYATHLCQPGMPNRYTKTLDTETAFGKDSASEGYAEKGMPNRYAERVHRTPMLKMYAEQCLGPYQL